MSPPSWTALLSPSPSHPSACCRAPLEFPESHSQFPLAIHFTYGIVNFYVTLSIHLPFSLLSSHHVHRSVLCLFLHCCPKNKFISAISSDSIYTCQYQFSSVIQSCPTLCDPMSRKHARAPCPSPTPRVHPNPCPLTDEWIKKLWYIYSMQ